MDSNNARYIYIHQGDDSDWNGDQFLTVNVSSASTGVDLSTMSAVFTLGSFSQTYSLENGSFVVNLAAAVTGQYLYGPICGSIKILDIQNRIRTVANKIPFYVTDDVITLQNQDLVIDVPGVTIDVTVGGTVNYNNLSNKPSINGKIIEGQKDALYYNLTLKTDFDAHIEDTNNPHQVTKEQVGLGNADNTSDANKPVSIYQQAALNLKADKSSFDAHIQNTNNPHIVTKAQVGLGNVDNTADLDKPVSIATQAALDRKQDNLSASQLAAVNSGIDSAKVAQIATNKADISTINGKIPAQASSTNQLADKNFVNSSIATNTANFIGTFNSVEELNAYSGPVTNNDYAFVATTDQAGNTLYDRYKYNGTSWVFEYELNNSSFTAEQWAAINSGAAAENIAQIAANTTAIAGKQDIIGDLSSIRSGAALGDTAIQPNDNISSLTNDAHYVTTTDYATTDTGGVVKVSNNGGTAMNASGVITTYRASDDDIDGKTNAYCVIVPRNLDYAVKMGITDNANTLTDAEKAAAQDWLGVNRTEPWLKPSEWVDIRSGALPNSVYFLIGHSADYATYPDFSVTPTISNSGTYDVYVDGIKKATTASATATKLNWQTLALNTGYDVTYPSALRTHIVRITPSTSTNTFTEITMRENSVGQQGVLWAHFTIKNSIGLQNFVYAQTGTSFPKLEAITCSEEALTVSNLRNAFAYNDSLKELPLLDGTGLINMNASFANTPILQKIRLKNCNPTSADSTFVNAGVEKLETDNCSFPFSSAFNYARSLKKLPPITAPSSDTAAGINQDYGLEPTVLDLNGFDHITKLVCAGESSTKFLSGLKGLTVSANAPFSGTSPQIDVRYSALDRSALVNLFNSMPTVTDSQVCNITGATGAEDLDNTDIAIAQAKGWTVTR